MNGRIKNERNFENGCTSKIIMPAELNVCILKKKSNNTICFSRFEVIKYMMAKTEPEKIKYFGHYIMAHQTLMLLQRGYKTKSKNTILLIKKK